MDPQLIADALEKNNITTYEQVDAIVKGWVVQKQIKDIDLALEQMGTKMNEATYSLRQEQEALRVERAALVASLEAGK